MMSRTVIHRAQRWLCALLWLGLLGLYAAAGLLAVAADGLKAVYVILKPGDRHV